jgi:hypothetical protein
MKTWVLIITLLVDSRAVGITSVPGYTSFEACRDAGLSVQSQETFDRQSAVFTCIAGPGK